MAKVHDVSRPVTLAEITEVLRQRVHGASPTDGIFVPVSWVRRLLRLLDRRPDHPITLVRDRDDLHDLLLRVWEYMDNHADVSDGAYGEQVPNRAMGFLAELDAAIAFILTGKPS